MFDQYRAPQGAAAGRPVNHDARGSYDAMTLKSVCPTCEARPCQCGTRATRGSAPGRHRRVQ